MVALVLLAVIRAEQVTARQQLRPSTWARVTKWAAFAATYVMNTWEAWGLHGGPPSPAGVVVHSVPPLLVLLAAEAGPQLREQLAQAAAEAGRADEAAVRAPADVHETPTEVVHKHRDSVARAADVRDAPTTGRRRSSSTAPRRRLVDDYLTEARSALAAACAAGAVPVVTPSYAAR
jgi:hypothetical protein